MSAIQTILAATDFSDGALVAVRRASLLAAGHGARLQLLHVMRSDALDELRDRLNVGGDVREKLRQDAQRRLDAIAEAVSATAGARPESLLRTGSVLDEAVAAADHADLLVLGAHGVSRTRDMLVGTTAERLLLKSRRPMLVVKREPQQPYRTVLVPVDFSVHSMTSLRFARLIAPEAHLKIFHAYGNPYHAEMAHTDVSAGDIEKFCIQSNEQALTNMANLIAKAVPGDTRVSSTIELGEARALIPHEAEKQAVDLVVVGKRGRSRVEELFLGGAARATVARARCDVVVVPEHLRL